MGTIAGRLDDGSRYGGTGRVRGKRQIRESADRSHAALETGGECQPNTG